MKKAQAQDVTKAQQNQTLNTASRKQATGENCIAMMS